MKDGGFIYKITINLRFQTEYYFLEIFLKGFTIESQTLFKLTSNLNIR